LAGACLKRDSPKRRQSVHKPVLLNEIIEYLDPSPGDRIVDCTLGGGGHAGAVLKRIKPGGILIGIDRDSEALEAASLKLKEYKENMRLAHNNFSGIRKILEGFNVGEIDGIIYDLGLSSLQLEEGQRGFSIKLDGPLDMRMDRREEIDAGYLVNRLKEADLKDILKEYGEERFSGRIARAIVENRPIETTGQLAEIIKKAVPLKTRYGRIHPATRSFQALRIVVNKELESIRRALDEAPGLLRKGARICVISFHSLEDRIVKRRFKELAKAGALKILTKRPIVPREEEVIDNARSRSAKLRVAEKI